MRGGKVELALLVEGAVGIGLQGKPTGIRGPVFSRDSAESATATPYEW
jgi:hypothetical protein